MFVAHLPVGYLVSRVIGPRAGFSGCSERSYMIAGMVGAIAPDLDLLYFYLIDHRQHNHHSYWTHYPSLWLGLLLIALVLRYPMGWPRLGVMAAIFSLNGLIHMVLDSVAGHIYWLAPLHYKAYGLVTLSPRYEIWWFNFMLHWTFLVELSLVVWAVVVWRSSLQRLL